MKTAKKKLSADDKRELLGILSDRFAKNMNRHKGLEWTNVLEKLEASPEKLWSLQQMEITGGEPDVIAYNKKKDEYTFCDCSAETPKGRRSICYDHKALEERKEHKPENSAMQMAEDMGIDVLNEEEYFELQKLGPFDTKTSSWIVAPPAIRKLGGGLYGEQRYGRVFVGHNGVQSYYAVRAFRGQLKV